MRYNVSDEYNRLIDENVKLNRAQETKELNPGSKITKVKQPKKKRGGTNDNIY